jgi:O-antigen/teichoic acid export membrane protein
LRRHGIARPDLHLGMTTLWYGARGHGTTVASSLNERLDLLILPAFLGATQVGIYAVATSVSWIVFTFASALNSIVLSVAARQGDKGVRTVVYSMHATMLIALGGAVVLGISADFALHLVYGGAFAASALPLRLLLPGTVLYVGAWILSAGLYAANRPFTAAATHILGAVITVPGLLIFLRPGGVVAAAVITTVSYAAVFAASLVLYGRATGRKLAEFLPTRDEFSQLVHMTRTLRGTDSGPQPTLVLPGDNSAV